MKVLKLVSFLLILNASTLFAQEICEDEKNSIIELSFDVKKADQKLKMKSLMKWYKTKVETEEDDFPYLETKAIIDMSHPNCSVEKSFLGIPYVLTKSDCNEGKEYQRLVAPLKKGDKKSKNKFLAQIFSKKDGRILLVDEIPGMMTGKVFVVHKQLKNGNMISYTINTSVNPALNPVQVVDSAKKKVEVSKSISKTVIMGQSFGNNNGFGW